jgi:hypothetical protein
MIKFPYITSGFLVNRFSQKFSVSVKNFFVSSDGGQQWAQKRALDAAV